MLIVLILERKHNCVHRCNVNLCCNHTLLEMDEIRDIFLTSLFLFTAQKISPEGKPKVQLQIVLHDMSSHTFHFASPDTREKQIAERNRVKVQCCLNICMDLFTVLGYVF